MTHTVITIARGHGSGGRRIGKRLAKELGFAFYDRELLRLASEDSGINERLFAEADETMKNSLLFRVAKKVYKGDIIPPDRDDFVSNENLFNYQAKVIRELAQEGPSVIVGRCADFVLKDHERLVRIYIHAPLETCIDRQEAMISLPRKTLEKQIVTTDKRRAAYYRYFIGRDWKDADHYDLCFDSSVLSEQKCVDLIRAYIAARFKEEP